MASIIALRKAYLYLSIAIIFVAIVAAIYNICMVVATEEGHFYIQSIVLLIESIIVILTGIVGVLTTKKRPSCYLNCSTTFYIILALGVFGSVGSFFSLISKIKCEDFGRLLGRSGLKFCTISFDKNDVQMVNPDHVNLFYGQGVLVIIIGILCAIAAVVALTVCCSKDKERFVEGEGEESLRGV